MKCGPCTELAVHHRYLQNIGLLEGTQEEQICIGAAKEHMYENLP